MLRQYAYVIVLMSASIALFVSYFFGAFVTELDLLDRKNYQHVNNVQAGNVEAKYNIIDNRRLISSCLMPGSRDVDFCGVDIHLTNELDKGIDLSKYDYFVLDYSVNTPVVNPRLRISFRNYNERYSSKTEHVSYKYNTVILADGHGSGEQIPLDYLSVETWWVNDMQVDLIDAQVDLTNVPYIELMNHNVELKGEYIITVNSFALHGTALTLNQLLVINSIILVLVISLLIYKQRQSLQNIATTDSLTGLANRRGLYKWIDSFKISHYNTRIVTVLYVDIDDFKSINDSYGHKSGDLLLQGFCEKTEKAIKTFNISKKDILFTRLSGDEFALVIMQKNSRDCSKLASIILEELKTPLALENANVNINVSMGIASDLMNQSDISSLFSNADAAMYIAKRSGKNRYISYDKAFGEEGLGNKTVARQISKALNDNQLELRFIPIFDTHSQRVSSVEVVLKANCDELAHLTATEITEIAEEFNLIQELDLWVLGETIALIENNRDLIEELGLTFCLNISTLDLQDTRYYDRLKQHLSCRDVSASFIELEIKETAINTKQKTSIESLLQLRNLGLRLTLDKFGTGYTGFSQLASYPIQKLKIDKSFVECVGTKTECEQHSGQIVLLEAFISLANSFDLEVVAVGVESLEQHYYFKQRNVHYIQGSLFSCSLTLEELLRALQNQQRFLSTSVL